MAKKRKRARALTRGIVCGYCGMSPAITSDHVIPRALFDPQPTKHLTIPCCKQCNDEKGLLDEVFRDYLVLDWQGCEHPVAKRLFDGKLTRSISKNHSRLVRRFAKEGRIAPHYDAAGLWVGDLWQTEMREREIERELEYIAKGLTFRVLGQRVPDDYTIEVTRVHQLSLFRTLEGFTGAGAIGPQVVGDLKERVFVCFWLPVKEDPICGSWLLLFYDRVMFLVHVLSPNAVKQLEVSGADSNAIANGRHGDGPVLIDQ